MKVVEVVVVVVVEEEEEGWYGRVVARRLIDEWDVVQTEYIRK
jgi:hypothetical protein